MSEESGAGVALRLLATLEGGTLVLIVLASLTLAVTRKYLKTTKLTKPVTYERPRRVLISTTAVHLGKEIKHHLECNGCSVISGPHIGADEKVDVLIIVGAEPKTAGLEGLSEIVSDDIYNNIKLLESLSKSVISGGRVVWVSCRGEAGSGTFGTATDAFDNVVRTQLERVASLSNCQAIWLGRFKTVERAAESVIATLMPRGVFSNIPQSTLFFIRYTAVKISSVLWRWVKKIT